MGYLNLDVDKTKNTVEQLNILLSDYHLYYQKLRNFHWNVTGKNFFDLHEKFEKMYDDAKIKIDEIAERILTLRNHPLSNFSEYIKATNLNESPSQFSDHQMMDTLLEDHGKIIQQMRKVIAIANEAGDEGTIDLVGAYIRELEKSSWMLEVWSMKIIN